MEKTYKIFVLTLLMAFFTVPLLASFQNDNNQPQSSYSVVEEEVEVSTPVEGELPEEGDASENEASKGELLVESDVEVDDDSDDGDDDDDDE